MNRALLIVLVLVVLAGVAALGKYVLWPERLDTMSIRDLDVDLSLEGVNLSQGKDGRKLWNLNATGASYAESGDQLTLTSPGIVYWGKDGDEPVQVSAPHGQVWQKEDRAKMWGGINATRGSSRMRSEALDYEGREHTLTLTGGVDLEGDRMRGKVDRLTYFLDSGDFLAQGHVQIIMN